VPEATLDEFRKSGSYKVLHDACRGVNKRLELGQNAEGMTLVRISLAEGYDLSDDVQEMEQRRAREDRDLHAAAQALARLPALQTLRPDALQTTRRASANVRP
jgi:hypothetical protein